MADPDTVEWFGKLAYMSFLLGPDAPAKAKHWEQLSERRERALAMAFNGSAS